VVYVDTAIDQTAMPLLANQEYAVPVAESASGRGQPQEDLFEPPIVTAGIFADGATTGDTALLSRLNCPVQYAAGAGSSARNACSMPADTTCPEVS